LKAKPMHIPLPCGFAFISISLNPSIFISCHAEPIQHMTITISFMAFMLLNTTCGLIIIYSSHMKYFQKGSYCVCCDSSQLDKTLLETQILLWVMNFSVCFFRYTQKNVNYSMGFKIYRHKNKKTHRIIIQFFCA
jgi:hypothetical protein